MRKETITTIETVVSADPTATVSQQQAVLAACRRTGKRLITRKDAAALLQVHPQTITRYERRGLLHPIRISARHVRFDLAEVEALLNCGAMSVQNAKLNSTGYSNTRA